MEKREIKFRAWDNVDYMSNPFTLSDLQLGKVQFTDDCIIMQFTGLKDKNGKDVFEGDIISYKEHNNYLLQSLIAEVVNVRQYSCFGYRYFVNELFGLNTTYFCEHDELERDFLSHCEVIGNIFQSPELLKTGVK